MSLRTALKALFGTAWHVQGDNIIDGMTIATDGTVEANKPVVPDASKDVTGLNDLTMTGDLTVQGTSILGNAAADLVGFHGSSGVAQHAVITNTTDSLGSTNAAVAAIISVLQDHGLSAAS